MIRVIRDDGTPACLPAWARDEIVSRRLAQFDLDVENARLRQELRIAQGMEPMEAFRRGLGETLSAPPTCETEWRDDNEAQKLIDAINDA